MKRENFGLPKNLKPEELIAVQETVAAKEFAAAQEAAKKAIPEKEERLRQEEAGRREAARVRRLILKKDAKPHVITDQDIVEAEKAAKKLSEGGSK